jgi:hypothetical protein
MNNTYNDTNKTEPYVYVIIIFAPILFLYLLQRCLLHTFLYFHRGTCCIEDENYVYEVNEVNEVNENYVYEANEANYVEEDDRFDGFDNISI